jgi:hypothetical protein
MALSSAAIDQLVEDLLAEGVTRLEDIEQLLSTPEERAVVRALREENPFVGRTPNAEDIYREELRHRLGDEQRRGEG